MFYVGFDSTALEKKIRFSDYLKAPYEIEETGEAEKVETQDNQPTVLKALIGASITTQLKDFSERYRLLLKDTLDKYHIRCEKTLYKGAHLLKQAGDKADLIVTDLLNDLEPSISHIDLYFSTYDKPYISLYGRAQGERITPFEYIERHKNGFAHACVWWYWTNFAKQEPSYTYDVDYFESKSTPAWRTLEDKKVNVNAYYNGCECNALISFADLLLKTIQIFHFGTIDYVSIAAPLRKRCDSVSLNKKITCYNLSKYDWVMRYTIPDIPLDINLQPYVKHPIYFVAWTPTLPRTTVKSSFEWSIFYNSVIQKAIDSKGCVKFLDFDKDMTFWENEDFIVPWEPADHEHIRQLSSMGFNKMPSIIQVTRLNNRKT